MNQFETLKHLENCYDAMRPAAEKSEQAFAWFSDIPHPLFNVVMHLSCKDVDAKIETLIEKVPFGNPVSFWVHPGNRADGLVEILKGKGFAPLITCPLMAWPVQPMIAPKCDIRSAKKDMDMFNQITSAVFHFDETTKQRYANILKTFDSENYLLFVNDEPVAVGILFSNGNIGGIFNIAVLPKQQKKGYGRAMMEFLMHRANALHLRQLVLLSSPAAERLYNNLEFQKVFDIEMYAR
ncbi:MAG TPA: GNAT family N-acetyltransferase [Rhabdochlamydiaceae bacterium]|nr:GNAT family N-acetyltransferase [Rhabdochlamydiaceae bacterium]HSX38690.1 GNAT family N-acetyltransferase [Chlamydiales bacterium]